MIKFTTLQEAIERKGYANEYIKAEDTKDKINNYIGFTADGTVWFWYNESILINDSLAWFDHRYNQANGSKIKTYKQEMKTLALLDLEGVNESKYGKKLLPSWRVAK